MSRLYRSLLKPVRTLFLIFLLSVFAFQTAHAQNGIKPLRSDVGIYGFTVNFNGLANFTNLANDTLHYDGSKEIEIVFRDIRMMSPRLGIGYEVLGSFFTNSNPAPGHASFGFGGFGIGPVIRLYPFYTDRFQPYLQVKALLGSDMGVGKLNNTKHRGQGFRMRLGMRAGIAIRFVDNFGIFVSIGPNWESGSIFNADAMTWQLNIGFDIYNYKR